jgi:hypothetical protein
MGPFSDKPGAWHLLQNINNKAFVCGFCTHRVSSLSGLNFMLAGNPAGTAHVCPNCCGLNQFFRGIQYPAPALGHSVEHVPPGLSDLYDEARRCTGEGCYTAAVLICRKMLMNIAVEEKAQPGLKFIEYVEYLANNLCPAQRQSLG